VSDIALVWNSQRTAADLAVSKNDLLADEGLETAVMLSLFTDRAAESGDVLPDDQTDRRGWWADALPVVAGDKFGSRLWLLTRAPQSSDTLRRAEEYTREALQWLIDDKVASAVTVSAEFIAAGVMALTANVFRPNVDSADFRFHYDWAAQEAKRA
jgi:phage gp46-like protein